MPDPVRALPEPIKPRALKRHRNGTGSTEYVTSDGWLKFTARYDGRRQLGFTTETLRAPELPAKHGIRRLEELRDMYCAPNGYVPWLVCDMDEGVLHIATSRKTAVAWAAGYAGSPVTTRYPFAPGGNCYEYDFDGTGVFIMAADVAHRHGFNPVQQPLYPFPDAPFEEIVRPEKDKEAV